MTGPSPHGARPIKRLADLAASWLALRQDYDEFYVGHRHELLAADQPTMTQLAQRRVALDVEFERIAEHPIDSCADAAALLRLLFDMTGTAEDAVQHRAASNILGFLQSRSPQPMD